MDEGSNDDDEDDEVDAGTGRDARPSSTAEYATSGRQNN